MSSLSRVALISLPASLAAFLSGAIAQEHSTNSSEQPIESQSFMKERERDLESAKKELAAHIQGLLQLFEADPLDKEWASEKSQQLRSSFSAAKVSGVALTDLNCKSVLCRFEIELSQDSTVSDLLRFGPDPFSPLQGWLNASEPCGFTLVQDELEPRIIGFVDCRNTQ
jgi:hypothetical protein